MPAIIRSCFFFRRKTKYFVNLGISGYPRAHIDEPVHRRAWVLQERLLSRRMLPYCLQDIMWHCNNVIRWKEIHLEIFTEFTRKDCRVQVVYRNELFLNTAPALSLSRKTSFPVCPPLQESIISQPVTNTLHGFSEASRYSNFAVNILECSVELSTVQRLT